MNPAAKNFQRFAGHPIQGNSDDGLIQLWPGLVLTIDDRNRINLDQIIGG